jgi:hypothetical protein
MLTLAPCSSLLSFDALTATKSSTLDGQFGTSAAGGSRVIARGRTVGIWRTSSQTQAIAAVRRRIGRQAVLIPVVATAIVVDCRIASPTVVVIRTLQRKAQLFTLAE